MAMIRTLALAVTTLVLCGCSTVPDSSPDLPEASGQLTVFAAASLTEAFDELALAFMRDNPGITVKTVYDGSSTLATQLIEGASADVFVSADEATMGTIVSAGVITDAVDVFASNTLQIAVAPGNPLGIRTLADLDADRRLIVLCAPHVPCGAASATLLKRADITLTPVSEEQNVKAVVTKVALGEADAGLVYTTDVIAAAGRIDGVPIDGAAEASNSYLIGIPDDSANQPLAKHFVGLMLSTEGQRILSSYGFGPR